MHETGDHSGESIRESNSQISNLFEYLNERKSNLLHTGTSNDPSIQMNGESDIYSVQKEMCSAQLDNIHEEEIVVQKMVEYYVPATMNYKFSEMFDSYPEKHEKSSPNIDYSQPFNNNINTGDRRPLFLKESVSGNSLKPVKSKSLTYLDHCSPKRSKYETMSDKEHQPTPQKYSNTFLNSERTIQELKQQNMLAQDLLQKYFKDDVSSHEKENNATKLKHLEDKKTLDTVSSLMKRYFSRMDESEQVCIKPSDEYVFLNTKRASTPKNNSVKFVRPFKYHKKYWESGSNFEFAESPFKPAGPSRKRSRQEFESTIAVKQDSSTDLSLKTPNVQFLRAADKHKRESDPEANKLLYKTDSKNFENTYSLEEMDTFIPEGYLGLRNLYGRSYMENAQEQIKSDQSKPRFNFQTLPNKNSKSHERFVKFLDSGSHIKVTDDDYKKWLKEKNFIKYTDFAKSSVSSITFRSISQKIVNYSITPFSKTSKEKSPSNIANKSHQIGFNKRSKTRTIPSLTASLANYKFVDIEYNNLYQLFIYEHIVISNSINFYCSFNATRIKKLTVTDRMYQLIFLLFCYYILSFMNNNVFSPLVNENWF